MIELRVHASIRDVGEAAWDELAGGNAPPFLRFAWLDALERAGCASGDRGWLPQHLTLHEDGKLVAAAPAYLKGNSEGEFVFDWAWADLARRMRIAYYPKLVVAIPFTPATAPRLLVARGADRERLVSALAEGLRELLDANELSSAHVLFPPEDEAAAFARAGFFERHGVQYQWHNRGYRSFDDFLATFDAKRRHQIRRERREVREQGITVATCTGSELTDEVVGTMYELYLSTVDKFVWGRRYLNRAFFDDVCTRLRDAVEIVVARDGAGTIVGGAFNLRGGGVLYGRYWGAVGERPFLHFEVCYYHGVERAIALGLARFEPGAGGEHKRPRGFEPTLTRSAHAIVDRKLDAILRAHVAREKLAIATALERA